MSPDTKFIEQASLEWEAKRKEDIAELEKNLEHMAQEAKEKLQKIAPNFEYTIEGERITIEGLSFLIDLDDTRRTKVLYLLQICPKCGKAERYRIEALWNIGQVITEKYIETRHTCVTEKIFTEI